MKLNLRTTFAVLGAPLFCAASALAAPSFFTYQGRYLNAGVPANGNVPVEFRVTNGGAVACATSENALSGPVYWTSGSTSVYMSNGVFSYKIGYQRDGATPDPAFLNVNWGSGTYYLDTCASGVELSPPDLIGSSPYSLFASTAGYATYVGAALFATTDTWNASQVFDGEVVIATEAYFPAGRLNLGGNSIVNVANPAALNDAANKFYVDSATAAAVAAAGAAVAAGGASAASANYHDFVASQTFSAEVTFATEAYFSSGRVNSGGNAIVNVGAPVNAADAANKSYVDAATATAVATAVAVAGAAVAPQVVYLSAGSFPGGNYTLASSTGNVDIIVSLATDSLGGHSYTVTLPAVTVGQEIKLVLVAPSSGASDGSDSLSFASGALNGGFPCSITGITPSGPGAGSASWLDVIGYNAGGSGTGWACF